MWRLSYEKIQVDLLTISEARVPTDFENDVSNKKHLKFSVIGPKFRFVRHRLARALARYSALYFYSSKIALSLRYRFLTNIIWFSRT